MFFLFVGPGHHWLYQSWTARLFVSLWTQSLRCDVHRCHQNCKTESSAAVRDQAAHAMLSSWVHFWPGLYIACTCFCFTLQSVQLWWVRWIAMSVWILLMSSLAMSFMSLVGVMNVSGWDEFSEFVTNIWTISVFGEFGGYVMYVFGLLNCLSTFLIIILSSLLPLLSYHDWLFFCRYQFFTLYVKWESLGFQTLRPMSIEWCPHVYAYFQFIPVLAFFQLTIPSQDWVIMLCLPETNAESVEQ